MPMPPHIAPGGTQRAPNPSHWPTTGRTTASPSISTRNASTGTPALIATISWTVRPGAAGAVVGGTPVGVMGGTGGLVAAALSRANWTYSDGTPTHATRPANNT